MHLHSIDTLIAHDGTIVVPTAMTARLLRAELDQRARLDGRLTWAAADVAPWHAWLERRYDDAALGVSRVGNVGAEFVLSREQERALWESVIASDPEPAPGSPEEAAGLAQDAWRVMHDWRLDSDDVFAEPLSEDVAAFRRWCAAFIARTRALGAVDQARLALRVPAARASALAHGFVEPAPACARALADAGIGTPLAPEGPPPSFSGRVYADPESELYAAASWAADRSAADPGARLVLAIEGLAGAQDLVRRCIEDAFGDVAGCAVRERVAFGIEESLLRNPVVQGALAILAFRPVMSWEALSALLLSPHTHGAEAERGQRATFDAELRALGRYEIPAPFVTNMLASAARPCPEFARLFGALAALADGAPPRQRLAGWLEHFDACLRAAGWPGEQSADPQVLRLWGDACDRLNRLDAVLAPVSRADALGRLRRLVSDTPLRAAGGDTRVFVVTPAQAAVLHADGLWLARCTADAFSGPAGPSPLLPYRLQRDRGVPGADANRDLYRARRLLDALARTGVPATASYAAADGDVRLTPSPLIPGLARAERAAAARYVPARWRDCRASGRFSALHDDAGPALSGRAKLRGGVAMFASQAACPFRGFARHRLDARAPEAPGPGIDARHKGTIVHRALALLWMHFSDHTTLAASDAPTRERAVADAIGKSLTPLPFETPIERALHFVERERLARLLGEWLDFELTREPFTVVAAERGERLVFEGLDLRVRVDRIDRLANGEELVIDYKTGQCREGDWAPPRMDQPQLPFYLLGSPAGRAGGVAYAQVRSGAAGWVQAPAPSEDADAWNARRGLWLADLTALAAAIRAGDARLDPKRGPQTCRLCDQHLFCRVAERMHDAAPASDPDD